MYPRFDLPLLAIPVAAGDVMVVAAVALGFWLGPRWLESLEGIDRRRSRQVIWLLTVAVFAGARLHFVVNHWQLFADRPWRAFSLTSGGLHAGGAIIGAALALPLIVRRMRLPLGALVDGLTPTIGVCIAVARIGCFLRGCCFGVVCEGPWCLAFPPGSAVYHLHVSEAVVAGGAAISAPVHPLQLYFAAAGLLVTLAALAVRPYRRYAGQAGLVGLLVHAVTAAGLELLRADYAPRPYWGPLPQLEWVALGLIAFAVAALLIGGRRAASADGAG